MSARHPQRDRIKLHPHQVENRDFVEGKAVASCLRAGITPGDMCRSLHVLRRVAHVPSRGWSSILSRGGCLTDKKMRPSNHYLKPNRDEADVPRI